MSATPCRILSSDPDGITAAAKFIRHGALVAFPTETVYGLGADATNDRAVAAIFAAKGRPRFNPLIIHFAKLGEVAREAMVDTRVEKLAAAFWPGPLSLVLPRHKDCRVSLLASAGLDTLAVRIPAHETARALIRAAQTPIAAPSANRSGRVSPTRAEHVITELDGRIAAIIDGGPCSVGVESTVLDLTTPQPVILRPGKITPEHLKPVLGTEVSSFSSGTPDRPKSPGQLTRHYAPGHPLRLNACRAEPGEALLGFGPDATKATLNLSPRGYLDEAAANLFGMIRALDHAEYRGIAVMPVPETGLGQAINDRLRRAAQE